MAEQRHDPAKEQYWRGLVTEWQTSGLNVREFCSQRQLRESNFYAWRRELRQCDAPSVVESTFVPVTVVPTMALVEVRCPSGHVVTLSSADRDTLRHLFTALVAESPR